jgi:hypothetical protein
VELGRVENFPLATKIYEEIKESSFKNRVYK